MPQHKRGPWSATEDQYLLHLVGQHGAHNWVRISSIIGSRSPKQCRERFHQNLKPNLNHEPITAEEGLLIEQMVAEMGKRWAEIARRLRGRSDNAVKNWWNGGMNRRRRSQTHRRQEVSVRQPAPPAQPVPQQQIPIGFQPPQIPHSAQQYYHQPMYQPQHLQFPQHMSLSSNVHSNRFSGTFDTPLPSPSAFSQISVDGAPSMVSDRSSISIRSPHNNGSPFPIELPPLSGSREERRHSAAPQLTLGTPGIFATDTDFSIPAMHVTSYEQQSKQPQMLQEPFMPAQPQMFDAHRGQYMQPVPPRQPSPMQQYQMQQHFQPMPTYQAQRPQSYNQQLSPMEMNVQLPRISDLASPSSQMQRKSMVQIDPDLMQHHGTPIPSIHTPEGSPKDKMSLSNITL